MPGGGFAAISGVASGKAAALVGGPPGVELQTVVDGLPSGDDGEMLPIVVATIGVGIVPNAPVGAIAAGDIVGASAVVVAPSVGVSALTTVSGTDTGAVEGVGKGGTAGGGGAGMVDPGRSLMKDVAGSEASGTAGAIVASAASVDAGTAVVAAGADIDGIAPMADPAAGVSCTIGVPGVICPTGLAQVTAVPGIVGSEASGTGANVVSAVPGWVNAENGLGPLSGEDCTAPGVNGRLMAVLPMVETCARQACALVSRTAAVNSKRRMVLPSLRGN